MELEQNLLKTDIITWTVKVILNEMLQDRILSIEAKYQIIFHFLFNAENQKHGMEVYKMGPDMVLYTSNINCWGM